jgi:hypothetical protein
VLSGGFVCTGFDDHGEPALHLFPHRRWEGMQGAEVTVWCRRNQKSVEFFLNGKSPGLQSVEETATVTVACEVATPRPSVGPSVGPSVTSSDE